jgi:hypothetical protein
MAPRIASHPTSVTVNVMTPATFSVSVNGATSVQWQRNGVNIVGATLDNYTLLNSTMADNGAVFRAVITN